MLELIDKSDCRKSIMDIRGKCRYQKCYDCGRFGMCLILNDGGELLPREHMERK